MVTTKPIAVGGQIVNSGPSSQRSLIELPCRSGTHMENFPIQNCFDDTATLIYLIFQEAGKVTLETSLRFQRAFSFLL